MEKMEKTYKQYFTNNYNLHTINKIKALKGLLKANKDNYKDFNYWYYKDAMTETQYKYFINQDFKTLKELLKKQIEKEKRKLEKGKQQAAEEYENIKKLIDIKHAIFEIVWSTRRLDLGSYQAKVIASVSYKNGDFKQYETRYTGGCGYDKQSTALAEACSELLKIVLLKHYNKIQKDEEKHYHFYAAEYGYYQHGVGLSSYFTFFKNCGYKVQQIYHKNEDTTLIVSK